MVNLDTDWFVKGRNFPFLNFGYNPVALSSHKAVLCDCWGGLSLFCQGVSRAETRRERVYCHSAVSRSKWLSWLLAWPWFKAPLHISCLLRRPFIVLDFVLGLDCAVLICSPMSNSFQPHGLVAHQAPLSMGILQAGMLEWVVMPILQGIFPSQQSNPGLPHCRWVLYHLSYQESPKIVCLCCILLNF